MYKYLFIILILIGLVFSAQSFADILSMYTSYIAIFASMSVVIIALGYMYGKFRNNPRFMVFFSDEIRHFIFTIILISVAGALLVSLNNVFLSDIGGINAAINIVDTVDSSLRSTFTYTKNQEIIHAKRGAASSFAYSIEGTTTYPFIIVLRTTYLSSPEDVVKSNVYGFLSTRIIQILSSSLYMQKAVLSFLNSPLMLVVLVVGLILRFIPITREGGNLLISAFFGLYFIYPLVYVLFYNGIFSVSTIISDICSGLSLNFIPCGSNGLPGIVFYSVAATFLPSLAIGTSLIFISNFKKVFDLEVV